ncbi:MAG: hypothetical protein CVU42_04730 [Chloroflexi bacterium HGW-Chloroflexi-4]|jgi:hypothetical protein|nr:MAG: hypothetical protein CVU42_04730 [Chloroflexi bacterium HGW-Chloroflexi-4]
MISESPTQDEKLRGKAEFLIFAFVLMLILTIAVLLPLFPNDFWPYVRIGQEIVTSGHIPATEFMTFTRFGEPAVYLYWLPSLIFWGVNKLGGLTLVSILSALCVGSFYTLLWFCLREIKVGSLTSAFVLMLTGLLGVNYWATRPQLLTYPLFGLALLAILRWHHKDQKLIWFLPLVAMIWANLHGAFIVLFFLLGPALLFGSGNRKKLLIVTLFCFAATCINYYGLNLWMSVFSMVNSQAIRAFSLEWASPTNEGWQANLFFATLLAIPVLTAFIKPKINFLFWVWFVGFGWMALSTVRYGVWFLPVEALLLGMILSPFITRHLEGKNRFQNLGFNRVLGVLLILFPFALLPGVRSMWWQQAPPVYSSTTPVEAVDWLKANPQLPDNIWSDFTYSTYLTSALPERKLFMTNRFEDFPINQFDDNKRIAKADFDWQVLLDQYGINLLMPSIEYQPELISAASASSTWDEVYRDEQTVIFARVIPVETGTYK